MASGDVGLHVRLLTLNALPHLPGENAVDVMFSCLRVSHQLVFQAHQQRAGWADPGEVSAVVASEVSLGQEPCGRSLGTGPLLALPQGI